MKRLVLGRLGAAIACLAIGCGGAAPAQTAGGAYYGGARAEAAPAEAVSPPQGWHGEGSGAASDTSVASPPMAANTPAPQPPPGQPQAPKPSPVATDAHDVQMLIYTAEENLAVFQVEQSMNAVEKIGKDVGGYLSSRSDQQIVIRVPRGKFDEAVARIETLGDVIHRNIAVQDVTDEYVDLQARLKNAYVMRDRLQELLKQANVKEAIDIQAQLGQVTETIERLEGQLKLLSQKIAYSTITVSFSPVSSQSVAETQMALPFPWLQELGLQTLMNVHQ